MKFQKMYPIDIYYDTSIIMERSSPKKIVSWIFILVCSFIIFFSIFFFYEYYIYRNYGAFIKGDILEVYYKSSDMPVKNFSLYIEGKQYDYSIVKISSKEVFIDNIGYTLIYLRVSNMSDFANIDNNYMKVSFRIEKVTLFQRFKKRMIQGGK